MKFSLIQVGFFVVFGTGLIRLVWLMSRRVIPRGRGMIWLLLWSIGLALVAEPSLSARLAKILGVTRGTDAVVYSAIGLLSLMVFRAFRLLDTQDRQISQLTTALALSEWRESRDRDTV